MALSPTVLEDAVIFGTDLANKKFNAFENRLSNYGLYDNFQQNADILLPKSTIETIKKSDRHLVKVAFLNANSVTTVSVRTCTPVLPVSTSGFLTLTYVTIAFDVGVTPALYMDNYIAMVEDLANQLLSGIKAVYVDLDNLCLAELETGKTTSFPYTTYANAGGAYQVPQADKNQFFQNVPPLLMTHDLPADNIQDITSTQGIVQQNFLQSQGMANSINQQFAFNKTNGDSDLANRLQVSNFQFFNSNRVVDDALIDETHWLISPGATGVYEWIDIDARTNASIHQNKFWSVQNDPVFGQEWGVYQTADCVDGSSLLSGLESTKQMTWRWSKDFTFVTSRNSTSDTPIIKVEITDA